MGFELPGGQKVSLAFEHWQQFEAQKTQPLQVLREHTVDLEDQIADTVALPRKPRAAPAAQVNVRQNVHQITIHGNNNGVGSRRRAVAVEQHLNG